MTPAAAAAFVTYHKTDHAARHDTRHSAPLNTRHNETKKPQPRANRQSTQHMQRRPDPSPPTPRSASAPDFKGKAVI